jgi:CheY-like chemotaxis protein
MGLSIVYGIVTRHEGKIEVDSEPGQGTTFTIALPCVMQDTEQQISEPVQVEIGTGSILVIDDDEGPRHVLHEFLSEAGYKVESAGSGKDGLSLTQQKEYDLVVTDIGMPDIPGKDVARMIKTASPRTKVVLCTGWGVQLSKEELQSLGVDDIIAKPFERQKILATVYSLLKTT